MAPRASRKRRHESPEAIIADSPASKRPRVQDGTEAQEPDEVVVGSPTNGHHLMSPRAVDSQRLDLVGGDQALHEELEEAAATPDADGDDDVDEGDDLSTSADAEARSDAYADLYLDTIDRKVLDFDFEKLCSVTLSNINVYACLVCGKYYQGRGKQSQAYFHALEEDHHVYVNMETKNVYVLPEGYEVKSKSLDDIKFVVDPRLARDEVLRLDKEQKQAWDLMGKSYVPGFVGMNNIKSNDYFNVVMHALAHVQPLRNFFMLEDLSRKPQLVQRFGTLVRKIWNPRAFKSHVSPHEILQEIGLLSGKRFSLSEQADPVEFLSWFLNNLHLALGGSKSKPGSSIVQKVFQGTLRVQSQLITARADAGDRLRFDQAEVHTEISRFMILTLDLPAAPLFQDELERNIIPQVPLTGPTGILSKYDGEHAQERLNYRRRYQLIHPLPPYLLFHVKRFSKNKFVSERNPTIVTFPNRDLDMAPYVVPNPSLHPTGEPIYYDLIANITHEGIKTRDDSVEGEAERKVWRAQLLDKSRDEWFEMQDLYVEKARAELISTKESYVQVWEKRRTARKGTGKA
jgi:U4/U6.U5 tri-snRNP-associated protein 2